MDTLQGSELIKKSIHSMYPNVRDWYDLLLQIIERRDHETMSKLLNEYQGEIYGIDIFDIDMGLIAVLSPDAKFVELLYDYYVHPKTFDFFGVYPLDQYIIERKRKEYERYPLTQERIDAILKLRDRELVYILFDMLDNVLSRYKEIPISILHLHRDKVNEHMYKNIPYREYIYYAVVLDMVSIIDVTDRDRMEYIIDEFHEWIHGSLADIIIKDPQLRFHYISTRTRYTYGVKVFEMQNLYRIIRYTDISQEERNKVIRSLLDISPELGITFVDKDNVYEVLSQSSVKFDEKQTAYLDSLYPDARIGTWKSWMNLCPECDFDRRGPIRCGNCQEKMEQIPQWFKDKMWG